MEPAAVSADRTVREKVSWAATMLYQQAMTA